MHIVPKLLAWATIIGVALGSPAATTTTTATKSCKSILTSTAKFDNLPTGKPPPSKYASINYTGFTVQNAFAYASFNAKSGVNVIGAGPEASYFTQGSGGYVVFGLSSFYFACASTIETMAPYPSACGLEVISLVPGASEIDIERYGPYTYDPGSGGVANMTLVNLGGGGGNFYFNLISGSSTTQLFLDNLLIYQQNDC